MNASFEPAEDNEKCLEKYGSDLTALARTGKLDPVIGRDTEIRDVIRILSRKTKNNPVLIGEPGVGKTAIVEGLAQRIVRGDVPEGLKDRTVFSLDMTALMSSSSTKSTRSSAQARPRGLPMPATCSSPFSLAANFTASARLRSTNTASTWSPTRRSSAGSSPCR